MTGLTLLSRESLSELGLVEEIRGAYRLTEKGGIESARLKSKIRRIGQYLLSGVQASRISVAVCVVFVSASASFTADPLLGQRWVILSSEEPQHLVSTSWTVRIE
jgi:hypothetical protein